MCVYMFVWCIYVHVVCMCVYVCVHMWRSEDNPQELVPSFHHVCSRDQTPAIRLGGKCLYPEQSC